MEEDTNFFKRTRRGIAKNFNDLRGGVFEKDSPLRKATSKTTRDFFSERKKDLGAFKDVRARDVASGVYKTGKGVGGFVIGGIREFAVRTPTQAAISIREAVDKDNRPLEFNSPDNRFAKFIYGKDPIRSFQTAKKKTENVVEELGGNKLQSNLAVFGLGASIAADYVTGGKGKTARNFFEEIAETTSRSKIQSRISPQLYNLSSKDRDFYVKRLQNERQPAAVKSILNDINRESFRSNKNPAKSQVLNEVDLSSGGIKRIDSNGKEVITDVDFPDFIPDNVRKKKLLNDVIPFVEKGEKPKKNKLARVYDSIVKEIDNRQKLNVNNNNITTSDGYQKFITNDSRALKAEARIVSKASEISDPLERKSFLNQAKQDFDTAQLVRYVQKNPQDQVAVSQLAKAQATQAKKAELIKDAQSMKTIEGFMVKNKNKIDENLDASDLRDIYRVNSNVGIKTKKTPGEKRISLGTAKPSTINKRNLSKESRVAKRGAVAGRKQIRAQIKAKKAEQVAENKAKRANKRAEKAIDMFEKVKSGKSRMSINSVEKAYEKSDLVSFTDVMREELENALVQSILKTARGDTKKVKALLKSKGVSQEKIESAVVMSRYKLGSVIKIKRESNGDISTVIEQGYLDKIKDSFKGRKPSSRFISKYSAKGLADRGGKVLRGFEIPQNFFERIGLKELIYDPVRAGEAAAEEMRGELEQSLMNLFKPVLGFGKKNIESRKRIFRYFAVKQGREEDMLKAGVKPVYLEDLTDVERKIVRGWTEINKKYKDDIFELAKKQGNDIEPIEDFYMPMYQKPNMYQRNAPADDGAPGLRKSPSAQFLKERSEKVDYVNYNEDAYENLLVWSRESSRFLKVGEKTLPIKYLIESKQFIDIVGENTANFIAEGWFRQLVSPPKIDETFQLIKRTSYLSTLAFNPLTIAKQPLSHINIQIIEGTPLVSSDLAKTVSRRYNQVVGEDGRKQLIRTLDSKSSSITERQPYIGVDNLNTMIDKIGFYGISKVDKISAAAAYERILTQRLNKELVSGKKLNNKLLRKVQRGSRDLVDISFGGATPAQRPAVYNSQIGEAVLALTSAVNSQFQYQIKTLSKSIKTKDRKMTAKALTAIVLVGYAEQAITRMTWGFGSEEENIKTVEETLKSVGGSVPLLGSLMFSLETGQTYQPSVMVSQLSKLANGLYEKKENGLFSKEGNMDILEALGLPTQFEKTYQGIKALREGYIEIGNDRIPFDNMAERARALVRGKYGTLSSQLVFEEDPTLKDRKSNKIYTPEEIEKVEDKIKKDLESEKITDRQAIYRLNNFTKKQAQNHYNAIMKLPKEERAEYSKKLPREMRKSIAKYHEEETKFEMTLFFDAKILNQPPEKQKEAYAKLNEFQKKQLQEVKDEYIKAQIRKKKLLEELNQ